MIIVIAFKGLNVDNLEVNKAVLKMPVSTRIQQRKKKKKCFQINEPRIQNLQATIYQIHYKTFIELYTKEYENNHFA